MIAAKDTSMGVAKSVTKDASLDASLRFDSVSFRYGKQPLIEGFTAAISEHRITSVIGPNGCGKSTLVKLANGFLRPQKGTVLLNGSDVLSVPAKERSRTMAVLSQAPATTAMTVRDLVGCGRFPYLSAGGKLSAEDEEIVDRAIGMVGLDGYQDRDIRSLSGGERQIAHLAMVIAQDTPLVLLDEPTTFLDIQVCHRILGTIREMNHQMGKTFLIVIHDIDLALRYSHELIVVDSNHVFQQGSKDYILAAQAIDDAFGIKIVEHTDDGETTYAAISRT